MDLILIRDEFREDGIFGTLLIDDTIPKPIAVTLEHAYDSGNGDGSYVPKVPVGVYLCVRGSHRIHSSVQPFETFEVTGVSGHSGILFHIGNYDKDSDGCILLGKSVGQIHGYDKDIKAIGESHEAYEVFMKLQKDTEQFILTVRNA